MILSFRCCIIGSGVGLLARKIMLTVKAGFSLLGAMGGGGSGKFTHPPLPPPREICFQQTPPSTKSQFPLTEQQFSSYNLIKTAFLAVVIAPASALFLFHTLDTQVMLILTLIDVQYSQKAVFSFEKGSNCQNHSSSGSLDLVKKCPQGKSGKWWWNHE